MISIYEAVAQAVQQPVQQAQGAVVPQQTQPQQQAQPAQVPAQQPAANAGQTASTDQPQQQAQSSDLWKKYLKYAAIAGAGLGLGAGVHYLYNNAPEGGYFSGALHFGGGGSNTDGAAENDDSQTEATSGQSRIGPKVMQGTKTFSRPVSMVPGPQAPSTVDPATYAHHMPQPANSRSWLDQTTGRRGYVSRGYGYGGADVVDDSILPYGSRGTSLTQGIYTRPKSQPITDYDLGRRSGDFNGA